MFLLPEQLVQGFVQSFADGDTQLDGGVVVALFNGVDGLAGNPDSVVDGVYKVGGIGTHGMVAVVLGFVVLLAISLLHLPGKEEA